MKTSRLFGILGWLIFVAVIGSWYFTLAPIQVGGPATYVRVEGISMEPVYKTGDLIVASSLRQSAVGEVVVFLLEDQAAIVHRIVGGDLESGWITRGDNAQREDPWIVPDEAILGTVIYVVPGGAELVSIGVKYPLQVGLLFAAAAALTYIPLRPKKLAPVLTRALSVAVKEPRRDGRTNTDYGILVASSMATLLSLAVVVSLYSSKTGFDASGWASLGGLVLSGVFTLVIVYRLYDGKFAKEPAASLFALSGRLFRVKDFPSLSRPPSQARSAVALRGIAEKYRLPILHRVDPINGEHAFLLILADGSSIIWKPARHKASRSAEILG